MVKASCTTLSPLQSLSRHLTSPSSPTTTLVVVLVP